MKKTLMIAATALALSTGAAALNASPAQAGVSVHVGYYGHSYNYFAPYCVTKYKFVRIKVRRYYGWKWIWVKRPYTYCY